MKLMFLAVLLVPLANAQSQKITPEEELVRTAYAKLHFAAQVGMIWHAAIKSKGWPGLEDEFVLSKAMNDQIRFELSGFKVGYIKDIQSDSWTSLAEGPRNVLSAGCQTMAFGLSTPTHKSSFDITYSDGAWQTPVAMSEPEFNPNFPPVPQPLAPSVRQIINDFDPSKRGWTRYASYTVVAMLREKSISYRAVFLFKDGLKQVLALDYAAQGIGSCIDNPMYPSALVDTAYREVPFIQAWIIANEITDCKKLKVPEVCCDPKTWQCGIASEDLQRSMKVAVDPETRALADPSR
jgi:hypothetical protein